MNYKYLFLIPLFLVAIAKGADDPLLRQLEQVNTLWKIHTLKNISQDLKRTFKSKNELLQLHLQLVEKSLRENCPSYLNSEQKQRRLYLLNELSNYCKRAEFPKNTRHKFSIPYFIDDFGTVCAVGQLIISSGNKKLVRKISKENNNEYIAELNKKYSQLGNWAKENGFEISELEWIQPCYDPPVDTTGIRHPTCHNANDGYFSPDCSQLEGPLTKKFYVKGNNGWSPFVNMCGQPMFYRASPGIYKWEVKDNFNVIHTYSIELMSPAPANVTITKSGDFGNCKGVAIVSAQGGILPYTYYWYDQPGNGPILTSVCNRYLTVYFTEAGGKCGQVFVVIEKVTGEKEEDNSEYFFFQNPISDFIRLKSNTTVKKIKIMNSQGQVIFHAEANDQPYDIDLRQHATGIYFLQLDDYKPQRFVKE